MKRKGKGEGEGKDLHILGKIAFRIQNTRHPKNS